ncbi:hypothetical protein Agau_L101314 [Agrobacterium tumefaciens F2]|nr:hypothetical protein Agau_L101314 [Agrobacterium tumefaciens F2]
MSHFRTENRGPLFLEMLSLTETASIGRCFKDQGYLRDDWS